MNNKEKRYYEILNVSRNILAEKGFDETKVSDITQTVGIAKGTFYLYFSSKLDLIFALIEEMQKDILNKIKKILTEKNNYDELIKIIEVAFNVIEEYKDVLSVINAVSAFNSERWEKEKNFRKPYYQFLEEFIKKGQNKKEFRTDIDTKMYSILIIGMVEHGAQECFIYESILNPKECLKSINQIVYKSLIK